MTEVWWCVVHQERGYSERCWIGVKHTNEAVVCEMDFVRLVPVDALVLTRGEDGEWPEDKLRPIEIVILNTLGFVAAKDILDALEAAGKKEQ